MLKKLINNKLCPLISLALAFGCGKKITESQTSSGNSVINQGIAPSPLLIIELIEKDGTKKSFTIPKDGIFKIPGKLFIEKGRGLGRKVTITYNKDPQIERIFEFKCTYKSTTQFDNLPLEKCEDSSGRDFGDVSKQEFSMDQSKLIEIQLNNPNGSNLEVHAWHEVDWR